MTSLPGWIWFHCCPPYSATRSTPAVIAWTPVTICGVVAYAGAKGEPLACGFAAGHVGAHAWATLPTCTQTTEGSE